MLIFKTNFVKHVINEATFRNTVIQIYCISCELEKSMLLHFIIVYFNRHLIEILKNYLNCNVLTFTK